MVCSCFGVQARPLADLARQRLEDDTLLVRMRAAEFLALLGEDPRPTISDILAVSNDPVEALLTLNTLVFLRDGPHHVDFKVDPDKVRTAKDGLVKRRLDYLLGRLPSP